MMLTSPAIFLKTGNEKTPGDAPMPIYRRDLRTFFFFFLFFENLRRMGKNKAACPTLPVSNACRMSI